MRAVTFEDLASEVIDLTVKLCAVPAPTFDEGRRAEVLQAWWKERGLVPVLDSAGNVWARVREGAGPALVLCAHMDTVFGKDVDHIARFGGGRLVGPGVGDNTVALAALTVLSDLLPPDAGETWLLATVGEEGLGNLAGIRHALDHPQSPIGWLIALEGNYLGRVVTTGVGSIRWRLSFKGPGGHAWEASDRPSAVHELAKAITCLDALVASSELPGRCSLNAGLVRGGEAINSRATHAEFTLEVRAESPLALASLEEQVLAIADGSLGVQVGCEEIGRRPAGSISQADPLVRAAVDGLRAVGVEPVLESASTDANAAYERGIPAVTLGVTSGENEHTQEEWIELNDIAIGLEALGATMSELWSEPL